ncbi:MAG: 4-hydroxybenzoate polyprenyltransferase [Saprospiraceae bacterium]
MKNYFSLVKFSHTIFALPFAMLGFFIALRHLQIGIQWDIFLLVLLCMIFARSAAMAFNRYLDRDIDAKNPRTVGREIPAGVISAKSALLFVVINCLLFIATTWFINPLCFLLSPVALLVILIYSYTKRFTFLCHFVLGMGLALAPIGAYLAVGGGFDLIPLLYSFSVFFWVAGFDIIYALQDEGFDKAMDLHSIPTTLGKKNSLRLSSLLHVFTALLLLAGNYFLAATYPEFSWLSWTGTILFLMLLVYQHSLVKPNDLSKINLAFFTTNGVASLIIGGLIILDLFV